MPKIYVLIDPRDGRVRYVGKTTLELRKRLAGHLEKARDLKNTWHNAQWIRGLLTEGLKPEIELIREVSDEWINETEKFCIAEYKRLGCDLTNNTEGGDGGVTGMHSGNIWSAETRRKAIETRRQNKLVSRLKGTKQSPELIAKRMASITPEMQKAKAEKGQLYRKKARMYAKIFDGYDPYSDGVWIGGSLLRSKDFCPELNTNLRKNQIKRLKSIPKVLSSDKREQISENSKRQWENSSKETKQKTLDNFSEYRSKFLSGEIPHPATGHIPWNKGKKMTQECIDKQLASKAKDKHKTQKWNLNKISEVTGYSVAQVTRTLKNENGKVRQDIKDDIWKYYDEHKDEYPYLNVVDTR